MTLQEAYVAFDMRESYLQRHASPLALQAADATELETKEFTTKSFNMWKTDEISLYPHTTKPCNLASPETIEDNSTSIYQEKVSFQQLQFCCLQITTFQNCSSTAESRFSDCKYSEYS